ncbi:MAG: hypothetical protein IPM15_01750 [Betaproteobacteria bacterium]|nr:hypothetical protein [Betaproteobacteria bacterium]MCC6248022.1 hypothetical protein [Rubrivivax sp.]MCL4696645.1 hypothetical protein [Burkholderiaceae bacterium]
MSDDDLGGSGGFAPPPFDADNALQQIKRSLRDLKLAERGNAFELRGKRVVELAPEPGRIAVKLARKLALTPEWDRQVIDSPPAQRKLVDEVKRRLERWERDE